MNQQSAGPSPSSAVGTFFLEKPSSVLRRLQRAPQGGSGHPSRLPALDRCAASQVGHIWLILLTSMVPGPRTLLALALLAVAASPSLSDDGWLRVGDWVSCDERSIFQEPVMRLRGGGVFGKRVGGRFGGTAPKSASALQGSVPGPGGAELKSSSGTTSPALPVESSMEGASRTK
jgi:hypothetical protein